LLVSRTVAQSACDIVWAILPYSILWPQIRMATVRDFGTMAMLMRVHSALPRMFLMNMAASNTTFSCLHVSMTLPSRACCICMCGPRGPHTRCTKCGANSMTYCPTSCGGYLLHTYRSFCTRDPISHSLDIVARHYRGHVADTDNVARRARARTLWTWLL
jgi:hypothetical protein